MHGNAAETKGFNGAWSLLADASGRIVAAGCSMSASSGMDMVVGRFNPDGSLDATFAVDGLMVHNDAAGGNGDACAIGLTLDSLGWILVCRG